MILIQFEVGHDPEAGTWTVSHQADFGPSHGAWLTDKPPRYEAWKRTCDHLVVDDEWAAALAADLDRTVSDMQAGCSCLPCREAVNRRMISQRYALPIDELLTPDDVAILAEARLSRLSVYEPEQRAFVPCMAYGGKRPTYADARRRYMETGTIADKEAMLACVTETEPDLETLGRDWEPEPATLQHFRAMSRSPVAALALALGAALLDLLSVLATGRLITAVFAVALVMLAVSLVLNPVVRRRRPAARTSPSRRAPR